MKNKLLKYAFISVLFLSTIFGITKVNAEQYTGQAIWPSEKIPNIFIRKERPDGYKKYQQAGFIRRSEDNKFVYCLQPYVDIDNNLPYYNIARSDYATVLNMTKEQWTRISLLAYYGYSYNDNGYNHSAQKWYAITQVLIWRTAEPSSKIYFTDTLNGARNDNKFASEIAEIESLVAEHYKKPSFNNDGLIAPLGQTITLNDKNEVLKDYKIESSSNVNASISGNTLTITPTKVGEGEITFVKKATRYDMPPVVYFSNHSQNVFRPGNYDPVTSRFTIKISGGSIELYKLDKDTKESYPQGNATLEGAVYEIYDTNYKLITTLVTDEYGYAKTEKILFPNVEYILKEKKASKGYLLDTEEHRFTLTEDNLDIYIDVYEKIIERKVNLFKVIASNKTGILTPEPNISFEIYLNDCNLNKAPRLMAIDVDTNTEVNPYCLVNTITTDKNGFAEITLPYGKYTFRQVNSTPNYEKVNDFEIVIDENADDEIKKVLSNAEITAKLKLIKVDEDSNKVLVRDGIKFKIKNTDTNEYVCQDVSYPTKQTICTFETKGGYFTTPNILNSGNYQIEELEEQDIKGYIINTTPIPFSINENSKFIVDGDDIIIELKFTNKQVKGEFNLTKVGEKFILEDGTFKYEEIKLNDVSFDLYANGDIYSQDGTLIYKDKEIVKSFKTVDGFYKLDNLYLGNYCIVETNTDDNHILDNKPYCFKLEYKDSKTPIISLSYTFKNHIGKGDVEISKTDLSTANPVPNALIEVYTEDDKLIFSGRTDSDGKITIKDLPLGKYKFIEKEAPDGYILNTDEHFFEIKEDGEIVKSYLTNEKEIFEVPKTSVSDSKVIDVVTIILVIAGIGFIVYDKRKNK